MTPIVVAVVVIAVIVAVMWRVGGLGRVSAESRLVRVCRGNEEQARRLIEAELVRSPQITREEAASRALLRYERDNR